MSSKGFRQSRHIGLKIASRSAKLDHDLKAATYDDGLHNRRGSGALPSQLGWGQHKSRKDRVSLFDPWRQL